MAPNKTPPRPGSSSRIVVEERVEPGAHRAYRERRPQITNRPPPESLPPPAFRREPTEDGPPNARPRAATLTGMPAPALPPFGQLIDADKDESDSDTGTNSAHGVFEQYAAQKKRADELQALLDARPAPVESEPITEKQIRKARLHSALLKLLGALTALAAAVATYLSVTAHTEIAPRVDNVVAKQDAQRSETSDLPDRVKKIEAYLRALAAIGECKEAHVRSAALRGTGYDNTTLSDRSPVHWSSEGTRPNLTWFPVEQCVTPSSPMPSIP